MVKRILVTGGAGFIGHHLVSRLLGDHDCKIAVVDNLSNQNANFRINELGHKVVFYREDIRNRESIADIVKRERIDTCVHLAAKISVVDSFQNPFETIDVNVGGTLSLLDACSKNNVEHFIFVSSAAVYGEATTLPISEDNVLHPLSPYGASKVGGEALVATFNHNRKIPNAISLRLFNVYGKGQNGEYAGVISKFAERLRSGLPPIIFGDGKQTRDFISVRDVVSAIIMSASARVSGTFNIGSGKGISIGELANKMITAFDLDVVPIYQTEKEGDIKQSVADTSKSEKILKFAAKPMAESELLDLVHDAC